MSRMDYAEDWDSPITIEMVWQSTKNALGGRRGQEALRLLIRALDAMPEKRIIDDYLCHEGEVCTVGAMVVQRRIEGGLSRDQALAYVEKLQAAYGDEPGAVRSQDVADLAVRDLNIARYMAYDLVELTDEDTQGMTPEERWQRVRDYATRHLKDKVEA